MILIQEIPHVRDFLETTLSAERLEEALTKVLSGYLSICSGCKKIRDADDEWSSIEKYVGERTEATFTHSMCEECGKDFYGDLWPSDEAS